MNWYSVFYKNNPSTSKLGTLTNFFNATIKDNEYDDDDLLDEYEIDDSGSYESVLEECQKILPEITLRWHYRSRDETLIAFSNKYIYENRLITFPSNVLLIPTLSPEPNLSREGQ